MMNTSKMQILFKESHNLYYMGAVISAGIFYMTLKKRRTLSKEKKLFEERKKRLVVISGCDSGLGLTMAYWAGKAGYRVLAGCLDENGEGAEYLRNEFRQDNNIHIAPLDVTRRDSIDKFRKECQTILDNSAAEAEDNTNPLELWAVIPNAAVAVFGEFLWQTGDQQEKQMNVNFWGTVNLTAAFKSMLFQHKSRLIVITSDCADYPLPFLGIYSATKAAQESWARSLRLEVAKYGVSVVAYQPGAFAKTSRLFASQHNNYLEIKEKMDQRDQLFYGDYFEDVYKRTNALFEVSRVSEIKPLENYGGKKHFFNVLEGNISLMPIYIYEDLGSKIFHSLMKYLPQRLSDKIINLVMLVNTKSWNPVKYPDSA